MILSLQCQFELRKTVPLVPRTAQGRFFRHSGFWGVCDDSGTLWPLQFLDDTLAQEDTKDLFVKSSALIDGSWAQFQIEFVKPDGTSASKYEDHGYVAKILAVQRAVHPQDATPGFLSWAVSHFSVITKKTTPINTKQTYFLENSLAIKKKLLTKMERIFPALQRTFECKGFFAAHTPTLVPSGGVERYLNTFRTKYEDHRGQMHELELPTSPEFALKKLLAEGYSKVYEIAKSFRNKGEISAWHEPEFWMLEWYRSGGTVASIQQDTQEIVGQMALVLGTTLTLPLEWPVLSVPKLFFEALGIDLEQLQDVLIFNETARQRCPSVVPTDDWDTVFSKVMMECIEPSLPVACFLENYPIQMGALAEKVTGKPFVKRFEGYLMGVEICNGYQELTDSIELKKRFCEIEELRETEGNAVLRDPIFEQSMSIGLPVAAGNALGLERVVAILLQQKELSEIKAISFLKQFPKKWVAEN